MKSIFGLGALLVAMAPLSAHALWLTLICHGAAPNILRPENGIDTRSLRLEISNDDSSYGGYEETRSYDGPYPMSDSGIGSVQEILESDSQIQFKLVRKARLDEISHLPHWLNEKYQEEVPATLDRETLQLTLDTSNLDWFYQRPSVLICSKKEVLQTR